jgi:TatA/E family protein of Tat protein translocase
MLSVPHMIVVFLVILVVFGPQKLPELARSFGKLMAEFRKASGDFKSAFEEEMRDLERQARIAELKKQAAEAHAAIAKTVNDPLSVVATSTPSETPALLEPPADSYPPDGPVLSPVADAVPRLDAPADETATKAEPSSAEKTASHDQQQPA